MVLANSMGQIADGVFGQTAANLDPGLAWVGALAYTFQIYFDFSAYSDMAIGLGHTFGFHFLENFNYPISPAPSPSSGGGGTSPSAPGSGSTSISPWEATG